VIVHEFSGEIEQLVTVPIHADGSAGPLRPAVEMLLADDFAFADSGALYVTTHPANAVVRLAPDGTRSTIAGPSEGAVGTTACAFGRAPGHRGSVRDHQRWNDHPVPRRAASGQAAANRRGEHAHLTVVACESLH